MVESPTFDQALRPRHTSSERGGQSDQVVQAREVARCGVVGGVGEEVAVFTFTLGVV